MLIVVFKSQQLRVKCNKLPITRGLYLIENRSPLSFLYRQSKILVTLNSSSQLLPIHSNVPARIIIKRSLRNKAIRSKMIIFFLAILSICLISQSPFSLVKCSILSKAITTSKLYRLLFKAVHILKYEVVVSFFGLAFSMLGKKVSMPTENCMREVVFFIPRL